MAQRIMIIGMYKSGTTWLLEALSRLPKTAGVREIDILKAVAEEQGGRTVLRPSADRLEFVFGGNSWCPLPVPFHAPNVFREFLTAEERTSVPENVKRYGELDAPLFITVVRRMHYHSHRANRLPGEPLELDDDGLPRCVPLTPEKGGDSPRPTTFRDIDESALLELVEKLRIAATINEAAEAFTAALEHGLANSDRVVYKAADQIDRPNLLLAWEPKAKKILIVRDARDAEISARHYRKLMADRQMPWNQGGRRRSSENWKSSGRRTRRSEMMQYLTALRNWKRRVDKGLQMQADGKLCVIRYEDLRQDFDKTFSRVLTYLEIPHDQSVIDNIREATRFENEKKKKKKGHNKKPGEVKRKGAVGEWHGELNWFMKLAAICVAGGTLKRMGYGYFRKFGGH